MRVIWLVLMLAICGCTSSSTNGGGDTSRAENDTSRSGKVLQAVRDEGFVDPTIEDSFFFFADWHGCNKDEVGYRILAKTKEGRLVKLTACTGMFFKGITIRH